MLTGGRLAEFYPDLADSHFSAPFAVFHERFSTNTMPRWRLAQPFRMLAHNGEINTLQSNLTHMKIREAALSSPLFPSPDALKPVIEEDGSDSSALDNVLELLTRGGRALPHSLMMLLPEPFGRAFVMGDNKRAFYDWHAAMMEAWTAPPPWYSPTVSAAWEPCSTAMRCAPDVTASAVRVCWSLLLKAE